MRRLIIALTLFGACMALPTTAAAQSAEDGTITVIQPKPVLRRNRVEVIPRFTNTINNPYYRQYAVGGNLNFSVSERVFLGLSGDYFDLGNLGGVTDRYEGVIANTIHVPAMAPLRWSAGLDVGFVPIYGKVAALNRAVMYFDLFASIGFLVAEPLNYVNADDSTELDFGGSIAIGGHFYINEWFMLYAEYRNRTTVTDVNGRTRAWNTGSLGSGIGIVIPFKNHYTIGEDDFDAEEAYADDSDAPQSADLSDEDLDFGADDEDFADAEGFDFSDEDAADAGAEDDFDFSDDTTQDEEEL